MLTSRCCWPLRSSGCGLARNVLDLEDVDAALASLSDTADWTSRSSSSASTLLPATDESARGASRGAAGLSRDTSLIVWGHGPLTRAFASAAELKCSPIEA
jgi:hypothetical protein